MPRSKYTKKIKQAVCDWVAGSGSLADFYKQNKDKHPTPDLVCKWAARDEEFRTMYHEAQRQALYREMDKKTHLLNHPPTMQDVMDICGTDDVRVLGQLTTQWKQKIASHEKHITQFASVFDKKYQKVEKVDQKVTSNQPQIVVMNYSNDTTGSITKAIDSVVDNTKHH